ncbi:hypothetical protein BD289DRAFT_16430 [Coniella lustricola]|uniref:Uncharacterized protein n=1 Tax=Coniella lustricola TaxID=2025994 RepID=A0A2T3A3S0_9PEZI|nr:hypothetical protein BD289DRAFT_16430 [Coniella lustricola]
MVNFLKQAWSQLLRPYAGPKPTTAVQGECKTEYRECVRSLVEEVYMFTLFGFEPSGDPEKTLYSAELSACKERATGTSHREDHGSNRQTRYGRNLFPSTAFWPRSCPNALCYVAYSIPSLANCSSHSMYMLLRCDLISSQAAAFFPMHRVSYPSCAALRGYARPDKATTKKQL